jgi:hypothetical protein
VEYLQTVLEGYLTTNAYDLAANCRGLLLEKIMETVAEMTDQQNHGRGSIRGGSQDGYDYGGMTPEDLQVKPKTSTFFTCFFFLFLFFLTK